MKTLAYCAALIPSIGFCYSPERAASNFSHELADCAAYYSLSAVAMKKHGDMEAYESALAAAQHMLQWSTAMSTEKTAKARFELGIENQMKEMDYDYSNFSLLIRKYAEICKQASQDPESRMNYWLNKE